MNSVTFTFMHLADTFIQSDLQCIQAIHFFFISMLQTGSYDNIVQNEHCEFSCNKLYFNKLQM